VKKASEKILDFDFLNRLILLVIDSDYKMTAILSVCLNFSINEFNIING